MYEIVGELHDQLKSVSNDDADVRAYLFANQNVYFLKMWNCYYCYTDIGEIAKVAVERGLSSIITDKMPEGIHEREAGMRLLSNNEIRKLQDILSVTKYWEGE